MQIELNPTSSNPGYLGANDASTSNPAAPHALANYQIIRRNGAVVPFEPNKIAVALMKAFLAVHGTQGAASASVREVVEGLTQTVSAPWFAHVQAAVPSTLKMCKTKWSWASCAAATTK